MHVGIANQRHARAGERLRFGRLDPRKVSKAVEGALEDQAGLDLGFGSVEVGAGWPESYQPGWNAKVDIEDQVWPGRLYAFAVREGDHYRITGQKIFITYGEQDFTENIIHLVLARLPDAPDGVKGISLFLVPKYLVNDDGSLGERNDVFAVNMEHKLGIHASPTCVMAYGDNGGAIGYLIGEEHDGLRCMFTMMNNARLNVGLQGIAVGERAYQQAVEFARTRVQSTPVSGGEAGVD